MTMEEQQSRNQAMIAMYQSGKTLQEVAESFGISRERVRQILSLNKVKDRHHGPRSFDNFRATNEQLITEIVRSYAGGTSFHALVAAYPSITPYKLRKLLIKHEVLRGFDQAMAIVSTRIPDTTRLEIVRMYARGDARRAIAKHFNISVSGVSKVINLHRKAKTGRA